MMQSFDTEVAKQIGLFEAVVLQKFGEWTAFSAATETNVIDGKPWICTSMKAMEQFFPYAGKAKIKSAVKKLIDCKVVEEDSRNQLPGKKNLRYALTGTGMVVCGLAEGNAQIEVKASEQKPKLAEISNKKPYGEFRNVLLTDDEYARLQKRFPTDYFDRIQKLSAYIQSKRKKYDSHYATILVWASRDGSASSEYVQQAKAEQVAEAHGMDSAEYLDQIRRLRE